MNLTKSDCLRLADSLSLLMQHSAECGKDLGESIYGDMAELTRFLIFQAAQGE